MEGAWITPDDRLVVQISGRHVAVPIAQLIEGAKLSNSHDEIKEPNLLRWDTFTKGPPAAELLKNARPVPVDKRNVHNGYSKNREKLGFDHEHLVTLPGGVDHTLFPSRGADYYREPGSDSEAENVEGYSLMAAKPFAHGHDWLKFFLLRSRENILIRCGRYTCCRWQHCWPWRKPGRPRNSIAGASRKSSSRPPWSSKLRS